MDHVLYRAAVLDPCYCHSHDCHHITSSEIVSGKACRDLNSAAPLITHNPSASRTRGVPTDAARRWTIGATQLWTYLSDRAQSSVRSGHPLDAVTSGAHLGA